MRRGWSNVEECREGVEWCKGVQGEGGVMYTSMRRGWSNVEEYGEGVEWCR